MKNKRIWLGVVIVLALLAAYVGGLRRTLNEKRERSLELKDQVADANHALASIQVIKVDPAARQLTARLRFRLAGNLALDPVTPKANLKLLVNNAPGQHVFVFPEGEGMIRIDATFPLEGDPNRYPFDRYDSNILLFMDTPRPSNPQPTRKPEVAVIQTPEAKTPEVAEGTGEETTEPDVGADVESELRGNDPVPLSVSVSASTPGMKYTGQVIRTKDFGVTRVRLNLKRPDNVINTSITVMCMMMGLALSVLAMVIRAVTFREKFEVLPLSLSMSLIFSLPALRNIQPYAPPVGVLGDYFSFIWAELFVAAAGIITALTWVSRLERDATAKSEVSRTAGRN